MKKSFLFLFLASLLVGCAEGAVDEQIIRPDRISAATRSGGLSRADVIKAQRFTEEMLASLIRSSSFEGEYTIVQDIQQNQAAVTRTSSTENDVPSLYIVNFEEGGWMIVAGHIRNGNQVLAYSETGSFDPSNIANPEVRFWYDMTKAQLDDVEIEESDDEPLPARSLDSFQIDMDEPYYWVRMPLPYTTEILDHGYVAPLLNTKWGQTSPWNSRTPYPASASYCYTGCVAVSCAQILYYLKQNKNFNIGLYDVTGAYTEAYDSYGGYFYISSVSRTGFQSNSDKWREMRKRKDENGRTDYVAELMFDIAEHAGMKFYQFASGTQTVSPSIFANYNVTCDESDYDFDLVRQSLDREIPVELSCLQTAGSGHSWVIDGYNVNECRSDQAYQWRLIPPDSLYYYDNIDYDYVFTESQKQLYHPELEENQIEHNYSYYSDNYLLMNWGWDGENDNEGGQGQGHYSIMPNWNVGTSNYCRNAKILHNFRQE